MIRRRRRSSTAAGLIASLVVAASLALATTSAHAKDGVGLGPGLDLVAQTPARGATPAAVTVRVVVPSEALSGTLADTEFRMRLHEPVSTREELWAAFNDQATTLESSSWVVRDWHTGDETEAVVALPITPSDQTVDGDQAQMASDGPRPLHIELADADGTLLAVLPTFLLPAENDWVGGNDLAVAVVVDLRLPPAHSADGGAAFNQAALERVLAVARILIDHPEVPLTVDISPETLDALALIGDDESLSVLRAAVEGRQLLTAPWTSLDIDGWIAAGRADVVTDGLDRGRDAMAWAGLWASTVMTSDSPPTAPAVTAIAEPATGVSAFVGKGLPWRGDPVSPMLVIDSSGGIRPLAVVDPFLAGVLQSPDTELGMQWARAELLRLAAAGSRRAVVVPVTAHVEPSLDWQGFSITGVAPIDGDRGPIDTTEVVVTRRGSWNDPFDRLVEGVEPTMVARLLDLIASVDLLVPVTIDDVLAQEPPEGALRVTLADPPSEPGDFGMYLARRTQVEQRLQAYESFLGDDPLRVEPLRTLLAVSAGQHLTTGERAEFLDAVDRQVTQGVTGVEFLGRGPITVTERRADLPVTLMNDRPMPVTVAVELASDGLEVAPETRPVLVLAPGRNDLSVPVEAGTSGRASIQVTVTTPDPAGAITLAAGTLSVRFADAEGFGLLILVWAAAALAAWWVHTLRKRSRVAAGGGGTVAAPGTDDGADDRGESGATASTSTGDQMEEPT